jgi:hypothetical protein
MGSTIESMMVKVAPWPFLLCIVRFPRHFFDDIVADSQTQAGALSGALGGEERIEDFFLQ